MFRALPLARVCAAPSMAARRALTASSRSSQFVLTPADLAKPINIRPAGLPQGSASMGMCSTEARITTLASGLRVASIDSQGPQCTVGVAVNCGSRYERAPHYGVSSFVSQLAFKSTEKYSHDALLSRMEAIGGVSMCQSTKDCQIYLVTALKNNMEDALEIISETVLRPKYSRDDIEEIKWLMQINHENMVEMGEPLIPDLLHEAAYGRKSLGIPQYCNNADVQSITPALVSAFHRFTHSPSNIVISCVGAEHARVVELCEDLFAKKLAEQRTSTSASTSASTITQSSINVGVGVDVSSRIFGQGNNVYEGVCVSEPAVWTGGLRVHAMDVSPSKNALKIPLTYIGIGFKSCGWNEKDIFAVAVLRSLLAGGRSFSSGGPGKGMYSRLYTNVLNREHWMETALADHVAYSDTGLFILQGAAEAVNAESACAVLADEMKSCGKSISAIELSRAKNQLKSSYLMNLESNSILFEDLSRQILATGKYFTPDETLERISAVTREDVYRVVKEMIAQPVALAAAGNVDHLPKIELLQEFLWANR